MDGLCFTRLNEKEALSLEVPFTIEEVFVALRDMNAEKALGPDGLLVTFWQSSWAFVKEHVMRMFGEFYEAGKFVKSLNASFLVMIPKKGGAKDIKDFRPISLMGSL